MVDLLRKERFETITKFSEIGCNICHGKIVHIEERSNSSFIVTFKRDGDLNTTKMMKLFGKFIEFFPAFYTPTHFKPQPRITIDKIKGKEQFLMQFEWSTT